MNLSFKNDLGTLEMGNGCDIRITDISGLALPKKIRNTASYAGISGNILLSENVSARTITVSGDIKISDYSDILISKMLRILNSEGVLYIKNGKKRCIRCSVSDMEFSKPSRVYREFVIQFTADYPYFTDSDYKKVYLFSKVKKITDPFRLPQIFSARINEASVYNSGDTKIYPVINVRFISDSYDGASVSLYNDTTGKSLSFIYSSHKDEVITIDAENRLICSDSSGDITSSISDDSYISDFYLECGKNDIRIILQNCGNASAECLYKNSYIENM